MNASCYFAEPAWNFFPNVYMGKNRKGRLHMTEEKER